MAATNVNIRQAISEGRFREDLYYRLNRIPLQMPPLRERGEDVVLLFRLFAMQMAEKYKMDRVVLTDEAKQMLMRYKWPGNIRQLKNITEQISILSKERVITPEVLSKFIPQDKESTQLAVVNPNSAGDHSFESEREILYKVLYELKNNMNDMRREMGQLKKQIEEVQNSSAKIISSNAVAPIAPITPVYEDAEAEEYVDPTPEHENLNLNDINRQMLEKALERHNGNRKYVRLSQDVAHAPDKYYCIPAIGLSCTYFEAYTMLARMIWQLQPTLRQQMSDARLRLSLPKVYSGVHIRGGDKVMEARLISGWQVIQALHPQEGDCIFVLTDNYNLLEMVRNEFPQLRIVSLCQPHEFGYYHQAFCRLPSQERRATIIRLLISVDILLHCRAFVGTITSGPSVFLMKVRARDPYVTAIDCPQDMLPDCLTLNIDDRADISRKSNGIRGTHVSPNNN